MQTAKRIVMKATASGRDPYVEIYSTFSTGLATTDPREPRGYSAALQREARETEVGEKQEKQETFYDRTRAGISVGETDTDEKELGRLSECGRHQENRRTTIVQRTVPSTDAPVDI